MSGRWARAIARAGGIAGLACALAACGGPSPDDPRATSQAAIVGGALAPIAASPVVFVANPEGVCTGVLVADNLVVTAHHCAAQFTEGPLECTATGELAPGSIGGAIGADDPPSEMRIYMASSGATATSQGTPDATGVQVLSTEAPSGCSDDLSFIVLNRSLPAVAVPVRLDSPTPVGESVSVWGYGQTMNPSDPTALRVYDAAQIVGIGPPLATTTPQPAPVRSVRVGTGAITCDGDSGGPILSNDTGALVAIVSIGPEPMPTGGCPATGDSPTTGPLLADYRDLVLAAFAAASAPPNLETPRRDAGTDAAMARDVVSADADAATPEVDGDAQSGGSDAPGGATPATGGCSLAPIPRFGGARGALLGLALVGYTARRARRRRASGGLRASAVGVAPRATRVAREATGLWPPAPMASRRPRSRWERFSRERKNSHISNWLRFLMVWPGACFSCSQPSAALEAPWRFS